MTSAARIVLQDARYAISRHHDKLAGEAFRVSWLSVIGLLRAVGHVLNKVDANRSPSMGWAIRQKWSELQQSRPEPLIFWEFIEAERNSLFKVYEHSIMRSFSLAMHEEDGTPSPMTTNIDVGRSSGMVSITSKAMTSFFDRGSFSGRREVEVASEAASWWHAYLSAVDDLAAHRGESSA